MNNLELMSEVEAAISVCQKCPLSETRNKTVPGEGNIHSPVVFIGEGPGAEEDETGRPFVGKAGRLFEEILKAVSFSRDDIYITNVVKCRPPNNRNPMQDEMNLCSSFLFSQLQIINPYLIVTLGAVPLSFLLDKKNIRITSMRGQLIPYKEKTMLFPMFHPSYLLRNPSKAKGSPKFFTWQDIQEVKRIYEQHRQ
ncbi:MAG TPA: uracil-DNA glycosylase [Thermotogota bacterium]|nr:uracil-DNA glycosylase [Thermotogota bacterium]HRW33792.1 uracil-DNA glycosylase [Thermotogota bacterium]